MFAPWLATVARADFLPVVAQVVARPRVASAAVVGVEFAGQAAGILAVGGDGYSACFLVARSAREMGAEV